MKKVVFFLWAIAMSLALSAETISADLACKAAANFASLWLNINVQRIDNVTNVGAFRHIYLYDINEGDAFVVMSSDTRIAPVLAYSASSSIDKDMSGAAGMLLRSYESQIAEVVAGDVISVAADANSYSWRRLLQGPSAFDPMPLGIALVGPLVETSWGEKPDYNVYCPPLSGREQSAPGSTAVAMAQLFRYWRFPTAGSGSRSYSTTNFGSLGAYFYETTDNAYNYSLQPLQLSQFSVNSQIDAVSALIYKCAISVATDFQYASQGGTLSRFNALMGDSVLSRYFGYQRCYRLSARSSFTDSAWMALLKGDIDQGRPIIYAGGSGAAQRTFLCDGYDSELRFHFNWGNSGLNDGFYTLAALAPSFSASSFNAEQMAITSILPYSSSLIVSPVAVDMPRGGGSEMVSVLSSSSASSWSATSSAEWLSVSPATGAGGGVQTTLVANAAINNTGAERTATITIRQAGSIKVVTVTQPDGTPSQPGWYGNYNDYSYNENNATLPNNTIVFRPEAFANLYAGQRVTKVCFMNNASSGNYTVRIYEDPGFDAGLRRDGHTTDISGCLGNEVATYTTVYAHQRTPNGIQTVTLPAGGYRINGKTFWVTVTSHNGCKFCSRKVPHSAMTDYTVEIPLVDSLRAGYLYTEDDELHIAYAYDIVENRQSDVEFLLGIMVENEAVTCNDVIMQEFATVCDSYRWHDKVYTQSSGSHDPYIDTVAITEDCDSIFKLYLVVNHSSPLTETSQMACSSYVWADTTLLSSGVYTRHFVNSARCDSTVRLTFAIGNNSGEETRYACDSFLWHGTKYLIAGDYYKHLTNKAGCDSLATVHLTIGYSDHFTDIISKCDSTSWHSRMFYNTTEATYPYTNRQGCPSSDTLRLTIYNSSRRDTMVTRNESYTWRGTTYRTSGNYAVHFSDRHGCDSSIILNLTILNPCSATYRDTNATVCDSMIWYGQRLTASGSDYQYITTNARGCDSIVSLSLTVRHSNSGHGSQVACESYTVGQHIYTVSGTYVDTLQNLFGCDSVNTLTLSIIHGTFGDTVATEIDHFVWYGETYRAQGTNQYYHTLKGSNGCDSVVTLTLTILLGTTFGDTMAVDCGEFMWRGDLLTEAGEYEKNVGLNHLGYDSIVYLHLILWPVYDIDLYDTACQTYSWQASGLEYDISGDYSYKLRTRAGCDSVLNMHLVIGQPQTTRFSASLENGQYVWDGRTYTEPSTYRWIYQSVAHCDSTVFLDLTATDGIDDILYGNIRIYAVPQGVAVDNAEGLAVQVSDIVGRVVYGGTLADVHSRLPLSRPGVYLVRVGQMLPKRVVVR